MLTAGRFFFTQLGEGCQYLCHTVLIHFNNCNTVIFPQVFEDLHDYMQTLGKILKLEPSKIFPGHGPVIDNPQIKIVEYIQHRLQREKQILDELRKVQPEGLTAEELVNLIYVVSGLL